MRRVNYIKVGSANVLQPADYLDEFEVGEKISSISCPRGYAPGSAWFLMARTDIDSIDPTAAVTIQLYDYNEGANEVKVSLQGYYHIRAFAARPDGDSKAPWIVELQDKRCVLNATINKQYNVLRSIPVDDGSNVKEYYTDSLNAGALWTWDTAWTDLWALLPAAVVGVKPTLPFTPATGKPKNLAWVGIEGGAWKACNEFLALIGCELVYSPLTGVFTVVQMGITQTGLAVVKSGLTPLYDLKPKGDRRIWIPEKVDVCFPKLTLESETPVPCHIETYATALTGALAGTKMVVWDTTPCIDYPVGTDANAIELAGRGTVLGAATYNRILVSERPGHLIYAGPRSVFTPGSEVAEVLWRDYGDGDGMVTEVIQKAMPVYLPVPREIRTKYTRGSVAGDNSVDGWDRANDCPTFTDTVVLPVDSFSSPYAVGLANQTIKNTLPYRSAAAGSLVQANGLGYWVEWDAATSSWQIVEPYSTPLATYALETGGFMAAGAITITAGTTRGGLIQTLASNTVTIPSSTKRSLVYRISYSLSWTWPDAAIRTGKITLTAGGVNYIDYFNYGQNTLSGASYSTSHGASKGTTVNKTIDLLLAPTNTIALAATFDQAISGSDCPVNHGKLSLSLVGG